jgi:hypothetical protein
MSNSSCDVDDLESELEVCALIAEDPVRSRRKAVQQALGAQEVDIGEGREEEQTFNAGGEADQVQQELAAVLYGLQVIELLNGVHPAHAEIGLLVNRRNVLHGGEGGGALVGIRDVVVQQREVELHVHSLFKQLAREIETSFRRIDVLVEIQHQVVGDDGVTGGEEGDQALDKVNLGRGELAAQIDQVGGEVDLFHGPGVLDAVAEHVIEDRVAHGAQGQAETGIENMLRNFNGRRRRRRHW